MDFQGIYRNPWWTSWFTANHTSQWLLWHFDIKQPHFFVAHCCVAILVQKFPSNVERLGAEFEVFLATNQRQHAQVPHFSHESHLQMESEMLQEAAFDTNVSYTFYIIYTQRVWNCCFSSSEAPLHELFPRASFTWIALSFKANVVFPCTSLRGSWFTLSKACPEALHTSGIWFLDITFPETHSKFATENRPRVRHWLGESPPWRNRPWVSCNYCSRWNFYFSRQNPDPKHQMVIRTMARWWNFIFFVIFTAHVGYPFSYKQTSSN